MIEWVIALTGLSVLFFGFTIALASRCISIDEESKRLEKEKSNLQDELYETRTALEAQIEKNFSGQYEQQIIFGQYEQQITSLKLALHMKQEKIDELQAKLKEQRVLLRQKWEGSKK